jgi:hypothetical protein
VGTTAIDAIAKLQIEDEGIFAFSSPAVKQKKVVCFHLE